MSLMVAEKPKRKEKPKRHPRRRGCLILLVILLLSPLLCYGAVWLFARYGGEWATAGDIPIPEGSELVSVTYHDDWIYVEKHSLYFYPASPEEVRQRFRDLGIGLTPIPLDFEGENVIKFDDYYGADPNFSYIFTAPQFLHHISVYHMTGYFNDMIEHCQDVRVYHNNAALFSVFPTADVPEGSSAFIVTTCWVGSSHLFD